ncbi:hypothetical protein GQ42DRAFT_49446 [Ramicandelaber brevisporus]|nr:hypothetical protein GQ42DRAFT_49446 [Ramicandelaber brevisporus]
MWSSNNALIPDRDKIDVLSSEPYEWPFMTLGMRMVGWEDHRVKFYLLGNPFVWIASAIVTFAFPAVLLALVVRNQRSLGDWAAPTAVAVQEQAAQLDATAGFSALRGADTEFGQFVFASLVLFAGWFLHYIPFYIMGRVTYLHHYFPAIYFSMLLAAHLADHAARRFQGGRLHARILVALLVAACAVFVFFRHVTFGIPFPAKEMAARRWRSSWNMYD